MVRVFAFLFIAAFAAACAGATAPTPTPTPTTSPTATPAASTPSATATPIASTPAPTITPGVTGSPAAATVQLMETSLGVVLVGPDGRTLYGFTNDADAGVPTCYGNCAGTWPPLTVTGDFAVGEGLDDSDFTLVARTDGTQQLQIGDYPLYWYAADANPGDVGGQGLGDRWYVVDANGTQITTAP